MSLLPPRQTGMTETHKEWCQRILDESTNLSVWETDFVESIDLQLRGGRSLSERQAEILERIYSEKTP